MRSALAILAAAALTSACGGQPQLGAGDGGPPPPLASYAGYLNVGTPPAPPLQTRFVWYRDPPTERPSGGDLADDVVVGLEATLEGTLYRTGFWRVPYSGFVQLEAGGVSFTRGGVVALTTDAAPQLLGADVSHWMIYLAADVPEGSVTAWWLGGKSGAGFGAGFHYVAVTPSCLGADALDACAAALQSAGTVTDAGAARTLCAQPFRLQEVPWGELSQLDLGTTELPACP